MSEPGGDSKRLTMTSAAVSGRKSFARKRDNRWLLDARMTGGASKIKRSERRLPLRRSIFSPAFQGGALRE